MATENDQKTAEQKPATTTSPSQPAASRTRRGTAAGVADASHRARTEVPGRPGVDGRLDNRLPEELEPADRDVVPQQIDGPDLAHQEEHTAKVLAERNRRGRDS